MVESLTTDGIKDKNMRIQQKIHFSPVQKLSGSGESKSSLVIAVPTCRPEILLPIGSILATGFSLSLRIIIFPSSTL